MSVIRILSFKYLFLMVLCLIALCSFAHSPDENAQEFPRNDVNCDVNSNGLEKHIKESPENSHFV